MNNVYTVKPTLSDRALVAATLAAVDFSEVRNDAESFEINWLNEQLGNAFLQNLEGLKDDAFAKAAVAKLRESGVAAKLRGVIKRSPIDPFMQNVPESIDKGILSFTHLGIAGGDYVLVTTPAFALANFLAQKAAQANGDTDQVAIANDFFASFQRQPDSINTYLEEITQLDQLEDFKNFYRQLTDTFLKQSFEGKRVESVVKLLLENGFCHFEIIN